jgi:hypothetical protein
MALGSRPFWQTLVAADSGENIVLTCDECFTILEYLAEEAAEGADLQTLQKAAQHHLTHCPDCRAHHLKRLIELEAQLATRRNLPRAS